MKYRWFLSSVFLMMLMYACGGGSNSGVGSLQLSHQLEDNESSKVTLNTQVSTQNESSEVYLKHTLNIVHLSETHTLEFSPLDGQIEASDLNIVFGNSTVKLGGNYNSLQVEFLNSDLNFVEIEICSSAKQGGQFSDEICTTVKVDPYTESDLEDTYTVGGMIQGLNGADLLIELEGLGFFSFNSSGNFTFPNTFELGDSYSVTIAQQANGFNCSVMNGNGTVQNFDVTNIVIDCDAVSNGSKYWIHPTHWTDFFSPSGTNAFHPKVAMNNSGDIIVAWIQEGSDGKDQVFLSEFRNGSWSYPSGLSDFISIAGRHSYGVKVAMSDDGEAIVVWEQYGSYGSDGDIYMSEYRNGVWSHPTSHNDNISPNGSWASDAEVAMNDSGDAVIVWRQENNSNSSRIYVSEYRNGSWVHPNDINDSLSEGGASYPTVAINDAGKTIIVWSRYSSGARRIYKSVYSNGSWSTDANQAISPVGGNVEVDEERMQRVAIDNSGNIVIVWTQMNASNIAQVYKSEYRNNAWIHPSSLSDSFSNNLEGQVTNSPYVAMNNNGKAVVVWSGADNTTRRIYKREYSGSSWSSIPNALNGYISPNYSHSYDPIVVMGDNGDVVITWNQLENNSSGYSTGRVFKSEKRNGVWDHPSNFDDAISPILGAAAFYPHAAMNDSGDTLISWYQYSSGLESIFKSHYASHD